MEDAVIEEVKNCLDSEGVKIDWASRTDIDEIGEYVEKWRILLWDRAFYFIVKKSNGYSRSVPFKDQDGTMNAVKRLVYRYDIFLQLLG